MNSLPPSSSTVDSLLPYWGYIHICTYECMSRHGVYITPHGCVIMRQQMISNVIEVHCYAWQNCLVHSWQRPSWPKHPAISCWLILLCNFSQSIHLHDRCVCVYIRMHHSAAVDIPVACSVTAAHNAVILCEPIWQGGWWPLVVRRLLCPNVSDSASGLCFWCPSSSVLEDSTLEGELATNCSCSANLLLGQGYGVCC